MANKRKKKKSTKIGTYKRISKQARKYIENAQKTKDFDAEALELSNSILKYLNKDGSLSKSKLRSEKAKKEFNELLRQAKYSEITYKRKTDKKPDINKGFLKLAGSKSTAYKSFEVFQDDIFSGLLDYQSYYRLVVDGMKTDITPDEMKNLLKDIRNRFIMQMPARSSEDVNLDRRYSFLNSIYDEIDKLNAKGNATDEDLVQIIGEAINKLKETKNPAVAKNEKLLQKRIRDKRKKK